MASDALMSRVLFAAVIATGSPRAYDDKSSHERWLR